MRARTATASSPEPAGRSTASSGVEKPSFCQVPAAVRFRIEAEIIDDAFGNAPRSWRPVFSKVSIPPGGSVSPGLCRPLAPLLPPASRMNGHGLGFFDAPCRWHPRDRALWLRHRARLAGLGPVATIASVIGWLVSSAAFPDFLSMSWLIAAKRNRPAASGRAIPRCLRLCRASVRSRAILPLHDGLDRELVVQADARAKAVWLTPHHRHSDRDGLTRPARHQTGSLSPESQGLSGTGSAAPNLNSSPVSHMTCMTIASLRATAMIALLIPIFLASLMPQTFSAHHLLDRRSIDVAASASR